MTDLVSGGEAAKQVLADIQSAAKEMPSLKKGEVNKHGGYNFVGIDTYYEVVGAIALKHGISLATREVALEFRDVGKGIMIFSYEFDLLHSPTGTIWPCFASASVPHPWIGAQTSGSAVSYATKQVLRSTFSIVTGEADADSQPPISEHDDAWGMSPKPVGAPLKPLSGLSASLSPPAPLAPPEAPVGADSDQDALFIYQTLASFLPLAKTIEDLEGYWNKNPSPRAQLKNLDGALHQKLVKEFKTRKLQLEKEGLR